MDWNLYQDRDMFMQTFETAAARGEAQKREEAKPTLEKIWAFIGDKFTKDDSFSVRRVQGLTAISISPSDNLTVGVTIEDNGNGTFKIHRSDDKAMHDNQSPKDVFDTLGWVYGRFQGVAPVALRGYPKNNP